MDANRVIARLQLRIGQLETDIIARDLALEDAMETEQELRTKIAQMSPIPVDVVEVVED